MDPHTEINVRGIRLHNLKNIDVTIPKYQLVVLTGVSGSGKSTLAMDTLYREGARQFMESLGMVGHGFSKPPLDSISGLSPSICVDQFPGNRNPRSTVGTATEVFTYLRILFARLGHRPCPNCGEDVPPDLSSDSGRVDEESEPDEENGTACPHCGTLLPEISMTNFSFNKPAGACPTCTGLGVVADILMEGVFDQQHSLRDDGVFIWDPFNKDRFITTLQKAAAHYGFDMDPDLPLSQFSQVQRDLLYYGVNAPEFSRHFPKTKPPSSILKGYFEGVITNLRRRYSDGLTESGLRVKLDTIFKRQVCPDCGGTRLCKASREVKVDGLTIIDVSKISLENLGRWLKELPACLTEKEQLVSGPIIADLAERVERLVNIGVGYLTMERSFPTLSAGEGQRIRLASLVGSGLSGMLYILDEPTIGLHQRDTARLIGVLRQLRDIGNTVLVIEHDLEMIRAADHVIEFGPGAGKLGGYIVCTGTPAQIAADPNSPTGRYLSGSASLAPHPSTKREGGWLTIRGAREHNLKNIDVSLPLGKLVAVTGVSGSGKSSLMFDILDRTAHARLDGISEPAGLHEKIEGLESIQRVVMVDQSPISRMPRSNAATYTDLFTPIRTLFAATDLARLHHLEPRHFSFNTPGGRCERCEGAGVLTVNMHFMPDVQVRCPACCGRRFKKDILAVTYQGVNISDVLDMTISEALEIFREAPVVRSKLQLLDEVGLGYLQLGQPATTLSGGEAQRVKLARELTRPGGGTTLYLLDEPTTGLHMADVDRLLGLLHRLVDAGNSVMVVEHHIQLIACADYVVDLGPEGGDAGGQVLACGTPAQVAAVEASHTGRCLREIMGL